METLKTFRGITNSFSYGREMKRSLKTLKTLKAITNPFSSSRGIERDA